MNVYEGWEKEGEEREGEKERDQDDGHRRRKRGAPMGKERGQGGKGGTDANVVGHDGDDEGVFRAAPKDEVA